MVPRQPALQRRAITETTITAALIASATTATTVVVIATPSPAVPSTAVQVTVQNATQGLIVLLIARVKAGVIETGHAVVAPVSDTAATKAAATSIAASQKSLQPRRPNAQGSIQIRHLPNWPR